MRRKGELGLFYVVQGRSGASQREISPGKSEPLQGSHGKRPSQIGLSPPGIELPPLPGNQFFHERGLQQIGKQRLFRSGAENVTGLEGTKQRQGLASRKHSGLETSGTRHQKSKGQEVSPGKQRSQATVGTAVGGGVGSGSHHPDYPAIHQFFSIRLFHLVADCHPVSRLHKAAQIRFRRMTGNSRHGNLFFRIPGGEGNIQNPRSFFGIPEKHFEEIPHAKEKKAIGVALLPVTVLLQHGSFFDILGNNAHRILLFSAKLSGL